MAVDIFNARVIKGDYLGGNVDFKYQGYKQDLRAVNVTYWQHVEGVSLDTHTAHTRYGLASSPMI